MELLCIGVSHHTAPISLRERLALPVDRQLEVLGRLGSDLEITLVSTCNRMEVYAAGLEPSRIRERVLSMLSEIGGMSSADLAQHLFEHRGEAARRHLFRVASSLDSMVVGEPQILGQVKEAFQRAQVAGLARGELQRTFSEAFTCAKRVRTETDIGRAAVSMASAAVQLAGKFVEELSTATALVVGAGEMGALSAKHLAHAGVGKVWVANRTLSRAEALAAEIGGEAVPFDRLHASLVKADLVISTTASEKPLFTVENVAPALKARRGRPLVMVDLSVPRDICAEVHRLEGVYRYDVDDIQRVVAQNAAARAAQAAKAEALVESELARAMRARTVRAQLPVLVQLRARAEGIAKAEVERTLSKLGPVDEKQRKSIEAMGMAIINKLLHTPATRLRALGAEQDAENLAQAAAQLFGLDEEPAPAVAAPAPRPARAPAAAPVAAPVSATAERRQERHEAVAAVG